MPPLNAVYPISHGCAEILNFAIGGYAEILNLTVDRRAEIQNFLVGSFAEFRDFPIGGFADSLNFPLSDFADSRNFTVQVLTRLVDLLSIPNFLMLNKGPDPNYVAVWHLPDGVDAVGADGYALVDDDTVVFGVDYRLGYDAAAQVVGVFGQLAADDAVGGFDEAEGVDAGVGGQRAEQSDVGAFGGFDRADAPVVGKVDVTDVKAGAFPGKPAGAEGGKAALVG